jgi:hypothetical protein
VFSELEENAKTLKHYSVISVEEQNGNLRRGGTKLPSARSDRVRERLSGSIRADREKREKRDRNGAAHGEQRSNYSVPGWGAQRK